MDLSLFASSQGTVLEMKKKKTLRIVLLIILLKISFHEVLNRWATSVEGWLKPGEV